MRLSSSQAESGLWFRSDRFWNVPAFFKACFKISLAVAACLNCSRALVRIRNVREMKAFLRDLGGWRFSAGFPAKECRQSRKHENAFHGQVPEAGGGTRDICADNAVIDGSCASEFSEMDFVLKLCSDNQPYGRAA